MSEKTVVPSGTKHRLSSPERRAAIVDAALHLFAEKGFRGTTTRELAARVGVSEPVLYEHFRTKRDLYAAIIDPKSHEEMEFAGNMAELAEKRDDVGLLQPSWARSILDWHEKDPAFIRLLLFSGLEGHELKDIFFESKNEQFFVSVKPIYRDPDRRRRVPPHGSGMIATQGFLGCLPTTP